MRPTSASPEGASGSPRVPLARLALKAALGLSDVLAGEPDAAGLRVTSDPSAGLLRGVSVTAQADGRYEVDLRLVTRVVPLLPLGKEVRRRVRERARLDGLADQLGTVSVEVARVLTPEEEEGT
jgi:hypothetical protein